MSTADEDWWDLQAGEYVLGTLTAEEHLVFDKLFETDDDFKTRVWFWRNRLDPLNKLVTPLEPSDHLLEAILARIDADSAQHRNPELRVDTQQQTRSVDTVVDTSLLESWQRKARFWRSAAVISTAAAAIVAGLLFFRLPLLTPDLPTDEISTVAVLQSQGKEPMWAISYRETVSGDDGAAASGEIVITVVGTPQLTEEQSHQLWMVLPEGSGVQSVGLIPNIKGQSATISLPLDLSQAAEFAVSLEPSGGVPGPEHGPVVTRNFIVRPMPGI